MGVRILLVICVFVFGGMVPALEINQTHVFNPAWPGHARLHEVWQLATNVMLAVLCVWLALREKNVRLASVVALCVTLGFLFAYVARGSYGGSMLAADGAEKVVAGMNVSVLAAYVMTLISVSLAAIAVWPRRADRHP